MPTRRRTARHTTSCRCTPLPGPVVHRRLTARDGGAEVGADDAAGRQRTRAGHDDVRQTWKRYGHIVPGGEEQARERLDAYLNPPKPIPTVAHDPQNDENSEISGVLKYRYRDSKPTERELDSRKCLQMRHFW